MTFKSFFRGALAAALITGSALSASADAQFVPLPNELPKSPPMISLKPSCDDRPAAISLLSRLRASVGGNDVTFRQVDFKGARYVLFSPKKAGLPFAAFTTCLPTYMGTEKDAQRAGLFVPGNDTPVGVMVYTPGLGFYGDPRAWTPLGKR